MNEVMHVVGARPNFMKAGPVISASAALGVPPMLVHTGQHYDKAMSQVFFDQLGLPEPDVNLGVGSGSHGAQTAALMISLENLITAERPKLVVVYGDINSTLAATLVCAKLGIDVGHVEAGLRSFDRSMPEEVNRIVTDSLSCLHFVTSPEAIGHLASEGVSGSGVHFVGNPMIDTLLKFRTLLDTDIARTAYGVGDRYGVVTLHRPANVDEPATARRIVEALGRVSGLVPLVFPIHPRGRASLMQAGLADLASIDVVEPLGYVDFMGLVAGSNIVLTDSGGIQEETTILEVPCLTLRENTERPITVSMGTNRLVGSDPDLIAAAAEEALTGELKSEAPPLWDGRAGARIAAILADS